MTLLDDQIDALTSAVAKEKTVDGSAEALIGGFQARLDAAVAAASAAGATPAQLKSLTDLSAAIGTPEDAGSNPDPRPGCAPVGRTHRSVRRLTLWRSAA